MHSLFNPDYLLSLSSKYNLRPSKKYGQNYLIDESVIERILEVAKLDSEDTVVEVGPGFGVLTLPLSHRTKKVIAYEIEKKLEEYWKKTAEGKNIEIVWGNVLKQFSNNVDNYKVVANLPYQITSAVIRMLLETENPPQSMVLMVQKEVGERICAKPGDMSLLSVAVQFYAKAHYEFTVLRSSFWPSPEVDSAVISISEIKGSENKEFEEKFFRIVKFGFANKRKLLLKNLEPYVGKPQKEKLKKIFDELGFTPTVRAQELSVDNWKQLTEKI